MRPLVRLGAVLLAGSAGAMLQTACASPASSRTASSQPTAPSRAPAPSPASPTVVLRGATVMPASGPAIPDGAVVLSGGLVLAVGPSVSIETPAGATEVDVRGRFVTPGVVDAHSHLGVYGMPGNTRGNSDGNEATDPVTAGVSAEHGFWPQDPAIRRALAAGATSMLVLPGSANLVGGRGFPVKLRPGRAAADMRFPGAPDSMKLACGENPKRVYGEGRKSPPSTRMGNVALLRQAFADARAYEAGLAAWEKKKAAGTEKGDATPAPKRDLELEALAAVMRGEVLVQNHCYRADEMDVMLRVAEEYGFKIRAFHHATEAYKLRDRLAAAGTGAAVWADWWGFKLEAWDAVPENAGLLSTAGARAIVHSDSPYGIQRLNQEAAKAMWRAREAGLEIAEEEALRWITLNPAWAMGVDARTGSLEPGKMADVVVWSHHPFSVYARPERVYVDGVLVHEAAAGPVASDLELRDAADERVHAPAGPLARPGGAWTGVAPAPAPIRPVGGACLAVKDVAVLSDGAVVEGATVVVTGGRVARVGRGVAPPPGCAVVDGAGKVLAPGFVDAATTLGLVEVSLEVDGSDERTGDDPVHAAARAADSVNPGSALFPVVRQGGVTGAIAVPDGGLVPGRSAFVTTDGRVRKEVVGVHVNLGAAGARAVKGTRGQAVERLRELLDDARAYGKRRADYETNRMRALSASRLDLEALQPVLAREVPLVVSADRAAELRAALALAKAENVNVVLHGAAEGWLVASELAAAGVPVVVDPAGGLPETFDALRARPDNPARLAAAGVKVVFSLSADGDAHRTGTLGQAAGIAVAFGMPYPEAVRAITSRPADVFGLGGGRVAEGERADLVLWSGDPLELSSRPVAMWIAGEPQPLRSRQSALLERYRELR